jgi:hypothetical protein
MNVLKYWDEDPDHLFNQYLRRLEHNEKKNMMKRGDMENKMLSYQSGSDYGSTPVRDSHGSIKSIRALEDGKGTKNSTALVPIIEHDYNLRAIHEIEMIKARLKDKADKKVAIEQKNMSHQQKKDKKLEEELKKRRVEMGVQSNVKGVKQELKALIYEEGEMQPKKQTRGNIVKTIHLVDMNEEEDRDREILNQFMKKYAKIWKFMF